MMISKVNMKYVLRLVREWYAHEDVIISVDFDDTISPWKWTTEEDLQNFKHVISVINKAKEIGAKVAVFTASDPSRFDYIRQYCSDNGLEIDGINENVVDNLPYGQGKKIYANIYLDDRSGLNEALAILTLATNIVRDKVDPDDHAKVMDQYLSFIGM